MKRFFIVFALLAISFMISCGGGSSKNDEDTDKPDSDDSIEETPDADQDQTGTAEENDDSDLTAPDSDTDTNVSDNDTSDTDDDSDTTPEQPDNGDSEPDDTDTTETSDDDTDSDDTADDDPGIEIGETRLQTCSDLPKNAVYNTVSEIVQSWDGEKWVPSSNTSFNLEESTDECRYKCVPGYDWNGYICTNVGYLTLGNICTGQTGCYSYDSNMVKQDNEIPCPDSASDDFYGQDAQYLDKCTAQSFTALSNVVVDNNTGLTWETSPTTENYTWEDRATHCNELNDSNFGGISTWRLPNPLEFITIVDISNKYEPATNSNFTGMPSSESIHLYLWTNSECKAFEDDMVFGFKPAYGYNRNIHTKNGGGRPETYKVLCVSGNELLPATSDDFTISSDGKTVTDNRTGLMWQKEHVTGKTWKQALAYCQSLNTQEPPYAGYSDWRLPNKNELASLINYETTEVPFTYFPDESSDGYFWTSSTPAYNTNLAWDVDFRFGDLSSGVKLYEEYVRCVR